MTICEYLKMVQDIVLNGYHELHVHTDASHRDGVTSVKEVFATTESLGRHAVAITDHGNMFRLYDGMKERKKYELKALRTSLTNSGVTDDEIDKIVKDVDKAIGNLGSIRTPSDKLIPIIEKYGECFVEAVKNSIQFICGVESYVCETSETKGYYHMVMYAKDNIGLNAIITAQNLAQLNCYKGNGRVTDEIAVRVFGEGKPAHGHVIATSACMQGPISAMLLKPSFIDKAIAKLNAKKADLPLADTKSIASLESMIAKRTDELKAKRDKKNEAKKLAGKSFDVRIEKAQSKIDTITASIELANSSNKSDEKLVASLESANTTLNDLRKSKTLAEEMSKKLPVLEQEITDINDSIKSAKTALKELQKVIAPIERINEQISSLEEDKKNIGDVYEMAKTMAKKYADIFGAENFYVELQNHGIPEEIHCLPYLKKIATELGLPMTIANDVHFAKKEDARKRNIVSSLRFNQPIEDAESKVGNDQLYFKSNDEIAKLFPDCQNAIDNTAKIAGSCHVSMTTSFHLPTFDTGSDEKPVNYLSRRAKENLYKKYPNYDNETDEWKANFEKRFEYELGIIEKMGYSSYIAIVEDFIRYGREIGGRPVIGPGRGSAAGSLVCYLIGITDIDPIRYKLLFERFLNPDRVSMPDIDTDFAPSIREKVVDYVTDLYSYKEEYEYPELKHTVCNIVTENVLAARAAIRNVGRVTHVSLELCDRIAKMIPAKPKMTIDKAFDDNPDFKDAYDNEPEVKKLVDDALLVEGIPSHTGVHAAGVIIADKPINEYACQLWNEKKQVWVIEYDMVSCEKDLGLLKMDFLGLKNLDVINDATNYIKKDANVTVDFDNVNKADDVNVLSEIYAKGNTNGVFQFESGGMKKTLVSFAPKSIDDVALLNAAYRPGPMQYIEAVTKVKFGKEKPHYIVPTMASILDETYGKPIYQEQIQRIFSETAGFSLGTADIIRRAMSKKHLDELVAYKDKFYEGLMNNGANKTDIDNFWDELLDFAKYAFNKSHAVAYSIVSYQTAWLKYYYPAEYMTALLSYTPNDKIPLYIREANNCGVKVLCPNINKSVRDFTTEDGNIRFGLSNIKGVSNNADAYIEERESHGEFKNFKDLIIRMTIKGVNIRSLKALILSGACDSIISNGNRKIYSEQAGDLLDSCRTAYKKVATSEDVDAYKYLSTDWVSPIIQNGPNFDKQTALEYEKELIGYYTSGHPLDDYSAILDSNSDLTIAEIDETTSSDKNDTVCIAGRIDNFLMLHRKSDGKAMCKFTLLDLTGEIECVCFTKAYEAYSALIAEKAIVKVTGYADIETDESDEGDTTVISKQFVVGSVAPLTQPRDVICETDVIKYVDVLQPALAELSVGNDAVHIWLKDLNEMRDTEYHVNITKAFVDRMKDCGINIK